MQRAQAVMQINRQAPGGRERMREYPGDSGLLVASVLSRERLRGHCFFLFSFYLFIWLNQVLVAARGIFDLRCNMQTLSCGIGDLVPWPGFEPGFPTVGAEC